MKGHYLYLEVFSHSLSVWSGTELLMCGNGDSLAEGYDN